MNIVLNAWRTTGHFSYYNFEECVRHGVYLQTFVDSKMKNICYYPGRALTKTEQVHVLARYRKLRRALGEQELREAMFYAAWEDAHVENELMDKEVLKVFTEALTA